MIPAYIGIDGTYYQLPKECNLHRLAVTRLRKDRDLKIVVTARNSATGVGKTTLAVFLALSWNSLFTNEPWDPDRAATLDVNEYFEQYRELSEGSVLLLDEAEQLDARRSMAQENVDFSHDWMMLRTRQIISILTLPSPDALDTRIQQLADVWINVTRRGSAKVHKIQVDDYGSNTMRTPKVETLEFPDLDGHPSMQRLHEMKSAKIHGEGGIETVDADEVERETKIRNAQRARDAGHTVREVAEIVDMSASWVTRRTEAPDSIEKETKQAEP